MPFIKVEIKNCTECPFFLSRKVYTADSWEDVKELVCTKMKKNISSYHEWRDKIPPIPDWCPILVKDEPCKKENVNTQPVVVPADEKRSKGSFIKSRAVKRK